MTNTETVQLVSTIVIGICVVIISVFQWRTSHWQARTAHEQLRVTLFDKRHLVYLGFVEFWRCIVREATFTNEQLFEFRARTADAPFLFGKDVTAFLKSFTENALQMRSIQTQFDPLPVGEQRTKLCEENAALLLQISNSQDHAAEIFSRYLSFDRVARSP